MVQIGDCHQARIVENATCEIERHTVLTLVPSSFYFIPLEMEMPIMQSLLSRTQPVRCPANLLELLCMDAGARHTPRPHHALTVLEGEPGL